MKKSLSILIALCLVLTLFPATIAAGEPVLTPNQAFTDHLETADTVKTYSVTLTEPGKVWVELQGEISDGLGDWAVSLANNEGQVIPEVNTYYSATAFVKTAADYLGAGTYFVRVKKGVFHTDKDFTITVRTEANTGQFETEPNNTSATANTLTLGSPITAVLDTSDDVDVFQFTLTQPSRVYSKFNHNITDGNSSSSCFSIDFLNSAGEALPPTLVASPLDADVLTSPNFYLAAGTYFYRIKKGNSYIRAEYTFTLYAEVNAGQFEVEPNDTLAAANTITLGKPITGIRHNGEPYDVDFYTFTLTKPHQLVLSFSHASSTLDYRDWDFAILKSTGETLLSGTSTAKQDIVTSAAVDAVAGTYYVKVSRGTSGNGWWNGTWVTDYTLTINGTPIAVKPTPPTKVLVTKVKLNKTKLTLKKGKSAKLKATATPKTAANKKVKWTTSNPKVATVTQSGKIKAKKKGTVTITATAADGGGTKARCKVTVK